MEKLGINWTVLIGQFTLLMVIIYLPALLTLRHLRNDSLTDTARVLWIALIVLIPWIGSAAYWIARPGNQSNPERSRQEQR